MWLIVAAVLAVLLAIKYALRRTVPGTLGAGRGTILVFAPIFRPVLFLICVRDSVITIS